MAVTKPGWLRNWLSKLNWDIFTWKVYIGDAIEDAIDWALDWINWGIDRATLAYNKAVEAWDKAVESARELRTKIDTGVQGVKDKIDTWWDDLGEWWSARKDEITEKIDQAKADARGLFDQATREASKFFTGWLEFNKYILPKLLDPSWITSFFGKGIASISDWWAPKDKEITDQIDAEVTPVRDEVNKHTTWLDLIKELFTDPEKWLLNMIERMLARFL